MRDETTNPAGQLQKMAPELATAYKRGRANRQAEIERIIEDHFRFAVGAPQRHRDDLLAAIRQEGDDADGR